MYSCPASASDLLTKNKFHHENKLYLWVSPLISTRCWDSLPFVDCHSAHYKIKHVHIWCSMTCFSIHACILNILLPNLGRLLRQFNAWLLTQFWGVWIALIGNPPNRLIIYYLVMWTNHCFSGRFSVYLNWNINHFHEGAHNCLLSCIHMEFYIFVKRKRWAVSQRFN